MPLTSDLQATKNISNTCCYAIGIFSTKFSLKLNVFSNIYFLTSLNINIGNITAQTYGLNLLNINFFFYFAFIFFPFISGINFLIYLGSSLGYFYFYYYSLLRGAGDSKIKLLLFMFFLIHLEFLVFSKMKPH